jgi:D-glycero-alpha-D-manno-heptose 1-phosphate guanylyltransferase
MEAIVLAGGLGRRLHSVVPDLPKPMAPVAGRPFLEILLSSLASKGFSRVVLSVGYLSEHIISHFGDRFRGIEVVYSTEESPLGTGGAIRQAMSRCIADHVFVFNGDTYLDLELQQVEALWQQHHRPIIVAREVDDTFRYGRLELHEGRLCGLTEKGVSGPGLINAGCYVLPSTQLNDSMLGLAFSFETDYLTFAVKRDIYYCFVSHGKFIDIGVPEDYARAQRELGQLVL